MAAATVVPQVPLMVSWLPVFETICLTIGGLDWKMTV